MFARKMLTSTALLLGVGAPSMAQVQKPNTKVAPLSASEAKLKRCEMHGTLLKTDKVPIYYGIVGAPPGYYDASRRSFPHANSRVMGGCVISSNSPAFQTVKYCPKCRAAEKRWTQQKKATRNR